MATSHMNDDYDRRDQLALDLEMAVGAITDVASAISDEFDQDDKDMMVIMAGLKGLVPTLEVYQELLHPFSGAFQSKTEAPRRTGK